MFNELFYSVALCSAMFGGESEIRTDIELVHDTGRIRADCITDTHYIEVGLDNTASSRDSIVQAVTGAVLNDLEPMVVVIDRDGIEDTHQWELEVTASRADVVFRVVHVNTALRTAIARHSRQMRARTLALLSD
ncbi:hypothetical protein V8J82_18940 [Gymnodinialimonas sp. 2305UL16-5]|uniref:hypothetical protein n=1 Tax=Gymnodinialimonas mytili TaxID=3126503 RepID=UPI0030B42FAE